MPHPIDATPAALAQYTDEQVEALLDALWDETTEATADEIAAIEAEGARRGLWS